MHQTKLLPLKQLPVEGLSKIREISAAGGTGGWKVPTEHAKNSTHPLFLQRTVVWRLMLCQILQLESNMHMTGVRVLKSG